jgi:hypothetical protein
MISNKMVLCFLLLVIISTSIYRVNTVPSWVRNGLFFEYRIEARIITNPPIREDLANYYVVGIARFVVTGYNSSGLKGYYELASLNDSRYYFARILGTPGNKRDAFIPWNTTYNSTKFSIFVDPKTIPEKQVSFENVRSSDNHIIYTRIKTQYDKNTGIILEYYYFTEVNETVNYTSYKYIIHYKLKNTNLEQLYDYVGKTATTTTTTNKQSISSKKNYISNTYEAQPYPIGTVLMIIGVVVIVTLFYAIYKAVKKR